MVNGIARIPLLASWSEADSPTRGVDAAPDWREYRAGSRQALLTTAIEAILQGNRDYNPLVLCGPACVGKSHVALGLAAEFAARWPAASVVVLAARALAVQYASGSPTLRSQQPRKEHRTADLLVLEDLHELRGKTAQDELILMIDAVLQRGGQVVATLREPPAAAGLYPRLSSRLEAGLILSLSLPELAQRESLLVDAAAAAGVEFEPDALHLLAQSIAGTVPELQQAWSQVLAAREGSGAEPITVEVVRRALTAMQRQRAVPLHTLAATTAKYFSLRVTDLKSASRQRGVVNARAVAMYLARLYTDKSLEQIGKYFGNRDHTTVLHNCRKMARLLETDDEVRRAVHDVTQAILVE